MALPWVYYGDKFQRLTGVRTEDALNIKNQGCAGLRNIINTAIIPGLSLKDAVPVDASVFTYEGDLVVRITLKVGGETRDAVFIVSRNPADALFNYYNGSMEKIFDCNFA